MGNLILGIDKNTVIHIGAEIQVEFLPRDGHSSKNRVAIHAPDRLKITREKKEIGTVPPPASILERR